MEPANCSKCKLFTFVLLFYNFWRLKDEEVVIDFVIYCGFSR